LSDDTPETTLEKKRKAQKIFHIFSKIETNKIGEDTYLYNKKF
ncbi:38992_t:CDS:2, partial [Gigaspora margarita]